jgi:hypothetical protein
MRLIAAQRVIPALVLAATGFVIALAPTAGADTSPLVPYGTHPQAQTSVGMHTSNHDEVDTTNGSIDLPF